MPHLKSLSKWTSFQNSFKFILMAKSEITSSFSNREPRAINAKVHFLFEVIGVNGIDKELESEKLCLN